MNNLDATNTALAKIIEERACQLTVEGYTPAHDDEHTEGQMALLASAYALSSRGSLKKLLRRSLEGETLHRLSQLLNLVGWSFKPKDPIRDLVRAGALILAELERRLRT
jgi:hypothetical protein